MQCVPVVAADLVRVGDSNRGTLRRRALAFGVLGVVVSVAVVGGIVAAGVSWFRGGTLLRASGGGNGSIVRTNEQFSFGIGLTTASGPSVVLDHVSASVPRGLRVGWSIYRTPPGGLGFGQERGPLGARWPTTPVRGYRVSQPDGRPEQGATWLVASVSAAHSGVYRLPDISIRYHSWRRPRRSAGNADLCLLVVAPTDYPRLLRQEDDFQPGSTDLGSVDPLVAAYERCLDPSLTN